MSNLGQQIRSRRLAFPLSLDSVARIAQLDSTRLEAIEAGQPPSTRELVALADALACDPAGLAKGTHEDPRWSVARFRSGEGAAQLDGHDLRLLARAAVAGRTLASLKDGLGEPVSRVPALRHVCAPSPSLEAWQHGYQLGAAARAKASPDHDPVGSVQALLEVLGVHVAHVDFVSDAIEAASVYELGAAPVILLNRRAAKFGYVPARRALLAHELCHLLHDGGMRDLAVVTKGSDQSPIEQRANGFAPSFLAPGDWVRASLPKAKDARSLVLALARKWGLSFEGAAWHAKNLELLDPDMAQRLARGPRPSISWSFEEDPPRTPPDQFDIEVDVTRLASGLLSETAIVACADGVISRARAAEILSLE